MHRLLTVLTLILVGSAALAGAGTGLAASPGGHGQPNQSCEAPGMTAPAGFSSPGFAKAELVYAGGDNSHSADNPHAVSQYDVACFEVTSSGH